MSCSVAVFAAPAEHSHSTTVFTDHATHQPTISPTKLPSGGMRHAATSGPMLDVPSKMAYTQLEMNQYSTDAGAARDTKQSFKLPIS